MKRYVLFAIVLSFFSAVIFSNIVEVAKVFEIDRPNDGDLVVLNSGEELRGKVKNESFSIRTNYSSVSLDSGFIAGIELERQDISLERIVAINGNRFSGFIDDEAILMELSDGRLLTIRRERIRKVIFGIDRDREALPDPGQLIKLKNGDFFHATVLNEAVSISTGYGKILLNSDTTEYIEIPEGGSPVVTAFSRSGESLRGILEPEDIMVVLDTGATVKLFFSRIAELYFVRGVIPDTAEPVFDIPDRMVLVKKGSFVMGDSKGDGDYDERPAHKVTLTYDFLIGKYETTASEFDKFVRETGRETEKHFTGGPDLPAVYVSWWDAISYCNWLSEKEGLSRAYNDGGNLVDESGVVTTDPSKAVGYRLPTEAEWEFAARGGIASKGFVYAGSDILDDIAWYVHNSGNRVREVGNKLPNELGIYDMSGNVYEWCSDWWYEYEDTPVVNPYGYTTSHGRILRGGSWFDSERYARVTDRFYYSSTNSYGNLGFRIARTVR